jgi:carotenoid phi-ring synthase / carotenoid chi-ring synthase
MQENLNSTPESDAYPVVILGAGLAGLVAAAHLAERGIPPLILETDLEYAGGRLSGGATETIEYQGRSWEFPSEHGVHALWGAYINMREILGRFLEIQLFPSTGEEWINKWGSRVRYVEAGTAIRWKFIPAPLHYLQLLFNYRFWNTITTIDFFSAPGLVASILWTMGFDPITEQKPLPGRMMKEYFRGWTPNLRATFTGIAHSMLAANSQAISLTAFVAAMRFYTMLGRDRWKVDYFPGNSNAVLIQPLLDYITQKGGKIIYGADVQSLQREGERWKIRFEDKTFQGRRQVTAENVISALHAPGAKRVFMNSESATFEAAQGLEFPNGLPSVVLRLWFKESPKNRASGGIFTGDFKIDNFFWLHIIHQEFRDWHTATGGSAIEVHIYGPAPFLDQEDRTMLIHVLHEVQQAFPEVKGGFIHGTVRRNSATHTQFIVPTESSLGVDTPWPKLYACGDWIAHPAPVLWMERCCVTALEAANRVLQTYSLPSYPVQPPHPPERIARTLGFLFRGVRRLLRPLIRGFSARTPSL